jgi:hypothetical protein
MNDHQTKVSNSKLWLSTPLVLLMLLTACDIDDAAPTRDLSKQLHVQARPTQALPTEEEVEEDESEDEDEVEVITDGGFEAGIDNPNWTATPGLLCTVAVCGDGAGTAGPEEGEVWAWFGGTADAVTETLEQTVTLPRGKAELEFQLWAGAVSTSTFSLQVTLDDTEIFTFSSDDLNREDGEEEDETTLADLSMGDEDGEDYTGGYEDVELDLSDYTDDKAHTLRFTFSKDDLGDTNLSLDEVSLEVELLEDATQDIVDMVELLPLKIGLERALIAKLNGATKAFERNKDKVGINNLRAFSNQVKALSKGKKPKIPTADANTLIASAQELIAIAR